MLKVKVSLNTAHVSSSLFVWYSLTILLNIKNMENMFFLDLKRHLSEFVGISEYSVFRNLSLFIMRSADD